MNPKACPRGTKKVGTTCVAGKGGIKGMRVTLASVGNPDFRQDPDFPLYGSEANKIVKVKSFKEASNVCRKFISRNELGSGNWDGGDILDDKGKKIARVSYNGRVWTLDDRPIEV
ncbi:unnamed protein product [marine sediment metagenome]|uniref:Uncharacterized protein n=1 Tax=marine sediment metagenome TaxID=412755 RepID=X1BHC0_9ZZZZ